MGEITISTEEYRKLVEERAEAMARIAAFKKYVSQTKYSIDKEMCMLFFGHELDGTEL